MAVHAHHSIAGVYDSSRQVTIEGTITQFQFVNPHPFLMVEVKNGNGNGQWRLEMDNRSELVDVGMTSQTLKQGDRIVVTGSPGRTQSQSLYIMKLDRPADGFRYEQIGSSPRIHVPGR
jgi:DNA/RNA endonuclease YhcR with UshA esterase domain